VALVGVSGGGKSTLAKLVARFYDPDAGAVRVDGRDLREVQLRSYRRQLGVVLQDPFLFAGTIADNIRFARPEATDEQVRDTAAAIGVDRVAARLQDGLEHEVREGGAGLSAGERQLISIARALLADPRILILDEATSNIDRPTEVLIERALDRLLRGRTSIIIAHRLTTVRTRSSSSSAGASWSGARRRSCSPPTGRSSCSRGTCAGPPARRRTAPRAAASPPPAATEAYCASAWGNGAPCSFFPCSCSGSCS
jgi:ABC-type phosphate transport system ATPase subunit